MRFEKVLLERVHRNDIQTEKKGMLIKIIQLLFLIKEIKIVFVLSSCMTTFMQTLCFYFFYCNYAIVDIYMVLIKRKYIFDDTQTLCDFLFMILYTQYIIIILLVFFYLDVGVGCFSLIFVVVVVVVLL